MDLCVRRRCPELGALCRGHTFGVAGLGCPRKAGSGGAESELRSGWCPSWPSEECLDSKWAESSPKDGGLVWRATCTVAGSALLRLWTYPKGVELTSRRSEV